jgi:uncharacterized protein (TIGR00290 family)
LYTLQQAAEVEIVGLLTTVTEPYARISMHGVRQSLLEQQVAALKLPVHVVTIPADGDNDVYAARMGAALQTCMAQGVETVAFGDLFLEDVRAYREDNLAQIGMTGLFPLWERDTRELAGEFIELGFKAVVTCVDTETLDASFAGRMIDRAFLRDLPGEVDPCGENGEFHSFVFDGPTFAHPIPITTGETVLRDNRFCFCDLIPDDQ